MPYIGHGVTNAGTFYVIDDLTMSSSTTYTLQVGGVSVTPKADNLLITLDGVIQHTPDAYTISGSTITFASAPGTGVDFYGIIMGQSASTGQGSIGADELKVTGDGTANQILSSDADGTMTWKDGTLSTTSATGDIIYRNNSGVLAKLSIGSTGQLLTVASGLPSWATDTEDYLTIANNLSDLNNAGTARTNIGLGNVTNESKATMFASPTFTGDITLPYGSITDNGTDLNVVASNALTLQTSGGTVMSVSSGSVNATFAGNLTIPEYVYHAGDTDTFVRFIDGGIAFSCDNTTPLVLDATGGTGMAVAGNATFAGTITAPVATSFNNTLISIHHNRINSGYSGDTEDLDIWINYEGYNNGTTRFRDFRVGDGKQAECFSIDGSTKNATFAGYINTKVDTAGSRLGGHNGGLEVRSTSSTTCGIYGSKSDGTFRFQLYGQDGIYGFLNSNWGNWDIRKQVSGKMYLNNDTTYYLQPETTSHFNIITTAGNATFGGSVTIGSGNSDWFTGGNLNIDGGLLTADSASHEVHIHNGTASTTFAQLHIGAHAIQSKYSDDLYFYQGNGISTGALIYAGAYYTFSARRFKKNIKSISEGLSIVNGLNPVTYKMKKEYGDTSSVGFIADEIVDSIPDIVKIDRETNEVESLDYTGIIPYLTKAVQELSAKLDTANSKITALENA